MEDSSNIISVSCAREELTEYYRLLAQLEQSVRAGGVSLLQLGVWTREPAARLKLLAEIVARVGEARGGALATQLYSHLRTPTTSSSSTARRACRARTSGTASTPSGSP